MARRRRPNVPGRPVKIGPAVWSLVRTHIPEDTIRMLRLREIWPRVAGPSLARHAWPTAVHDGEVVVDVRDSQWLHELTYMRKALLDKLRALCPDVPIRALRLRQASRERPPMPRPLPLPPPPPPPPPDPLDDPPEPATVAAIEALHDPELRDVIAAARGLRRA